MFGKKVSLEEYNEVYEKYQVFEASCKNAELKNEELEKEVLSLKKQFLELTDQIKKLKKAGNVLPEDLVKRAEEAEIKAKELTVLLEVKKSKNQDSEVNMQMLKSNEQLLADNKLLYESALRELEVEKTKNVELTAKLQTFNGGNKMAELTQWEYKTLDTWSGDKEIDKKLQQLGENGWEQSGQINSSQGATDKLLFKRPKQKQNNQTNSYDYGFSSIDN